MPPRKPFTKPRGICPCCDRDAALLSDGRIAGGHWPCPGTGNLPKALFETKRIALPETTNLEEQL
jgi:hypothetical protein